jgi:hypothetical protein
MPENENQSAAWVDHMRAGAFEEAWKCSDKVLASGLNRDYNNLPRHFQCIWDGTPPDGKRVLVRCYHGLGDTIMFARYMAMLKNRAGEVILWSQPALIEVLTTVSGIDRIFPLHDGVPDIEYDIDVEIMELPHLFRTTLGTIPLDIPYIHLEPLFNDGNPLPPNDGNPLLPNDGNPLPPKDGNPLPPKDGNPLPPKGGLKPKYDYNNRVSEKLRVGLVWKAGDWDESRNIPFQLLTSLFSNQDLEFIILQDKAEQAGWSQDYGVHPGQCSLFEHARIIAGLDLMITADTMTAHLAGALGVPVWVMLPAIADWRWMENRSDSPWYPTMRLFRQKTPGDWSTVIQENLTPYTLLLTPPHSSPLTPHP